MTFLILTAIVILAWVVVTLVRNHAPAMFAARVAGALYDLGLDVKKLDGPFRKKLEIETLAYQGATKRKANHHLFAARFFVFTLVESERPPYHAVVKEGALVGSIALIRSWAKKCHIPKDIAEKEIERVKLFLVKNLPSKTMAKDERLALEIQILEL
jgi:hypothetical protein